MATSAKARANPRKSKPLPPVQSFVHEINSHTGEHRIVVINRGLDTIAKGEWARNNQIATLDDLRACTDQYAGVLPEGIFHCRSIHTTKL